MLAGGVGGREDSVATICLLVDGNIVRKTSKEVQLAFNPAENLLGGNEDLEVSEAD